MFQYSIGITSLSISQYGLDTVSHNIANANTPGFHRRQAILQALPEYKLNGRMFGGGVGLGNYRQIRDQLLENALSSSIGDLSAAQQQVRGDTRIETLFGTGPGSIENLFARFQGALGQLSTDVSNSTQRQLVIDSAQTLTSQIQSTSNSLHSLRGEVGRQIDADVRELNQKMAELSGIEQRLSVANLAVEGASLVDRRDALINEIAEIIDVDRNELKRNGFGLTLGNGTLTVGQVPMTVSAKREADGSISLIVDQFGIPLRPQGGRLASLLESYNVTINSFRDRLNGITAGMIGAIDQAHASGIGPSGPFGRLVSGRAVNSSSVPLNDAGLSLPINPGRLFVTVTSPDGNLRTSSIDYNPATDSLDDIANRLSAIDGIVASTTTGGNLSILGLGGHRFDFTGRPDTIPDLSSFSGSAIPTFSGAYTDTTNDSVRVVINGNGTIGETPGLTADVFNEAGDLLSTIQIGEGYDAGSELKIGRGIQIAFADGDVVAGDSVQSPLIANPDSGNLLSGLGLNSFFSGSDASNIRVSERIVDDPRMMATGRTADNSDSSNLKRLTQALDQPVDGSLTVAESLISLSTTIGSRVATGMALQSQLEGIKTQYQNERDSHIGVDINEELVNLTRYQKSYEAALRVLQTIDQMYDETIRILG